MVNSHYLYFINHFIQSRILNKKRPLLASFKITHSCNLKCRTCPIWKQPNKSTSYHQALSIIDRLYKAGVRLLIFEGGEPFLWHDKNYTLNDLILYAKKKFFNVGVTTNGLLPLTTSADTIWVSIDGLKETHDLNRGPSFNKIIRNVKASSHPNILANITISQLNIQRIPELIKFLSSVVKGITIQFYYPFPNSERLEVSPNDRIDVLDKLIHLKKDGYPLLDSISTLKALKKNTWKCHSWLIASAEPDGQITFGCYIKNRGGIFCEKCGFAAHTEISKAFDLNIEAIMVGKRVFKFRFI